MCLATMDAARPTSTFRGCVAQEPSVTVPGKDRHAGCLEAVTRLLDSRIFAKPPVRSRGELCQKLDVGVYCQAGPAASQTGSPGLSFPS